MPAEFLQAFFLIRNGLLMCGRRGEYRSVDKTNHPSSVFKHTLFDYENTFNTATESVFEVGKGTGNKL
jgi:hypothetical protein